MKIKKLLLLLIITSFVSNAQTVSNITTRQEQSTIIISYDLETKLPCKIDLYVSSNGGNTWQGPLKKVIGDVGTKIESGKHSITWNVLDEFEELSGTNIKFQVRAELSNIQSIASINKAIIKNPKDSKLFKLRGDLKLELIDVKGAIADYTKAILLNPKYADAYKARGYVMDNNNSNYEAAISDFSKAISFNSKDASTFYYRANSKSGLEDYNGTLSDYLKALELEPNNTKFLYAKATVKRYLKDFIGAVEDSNKVIELDSTYRNIYYFSGINKFDLGDFEGANYDFEKDIKKSNNPNYECNRIANWRWNNKDYKTAIVYFTKAIEVLLEAKSDNIVKVDTTDFYDYESYLGRAFSKYKLNDYSGANSDFDNFIEKYQDKAEAYKQIAEHYQYSYNELGDFENAIKYLTKAINITPKKKYFISRAEIKIKLKDYRAAIEDYSRAIEIEPDAFSYTYRASAKEELIDYRGAIADYSQAILFEPKTDYLYYNLGNAKFNLKDYRGAIADFSKAILLAPNSEDYYLIRGNAKYNIGDYKGAIADYSKVILLDPKSGEVYLNRGDAKILLKDKVGACKDFSKAGELGVDGAYEAINENCNK